VSDEGRRYRLLVVDDEEILLRSLTRLLHRAGYDVEVHRDAASGCAALRASPFDAVITDLMIGNHATGVEVVRASRDLGLPVLVFTGVGLDDAARTAGVPPEQVLAKPVLPSEMLQAVAAACASGKN
jgi:DNA-binding NtrC family response regulator